MNKSIKDRVLEAMEDWDSERLRSELHAYISSDTEEQLANDFFDDIATEEEQQNHKLNIATDTEVGGNEKQFLEDTRDILIDYDGCHSEQQLKALINETKDRLTAFLNGSINEFEKSGEVIGKWYYQKKR